MEVTEKTYSILMTDDKGLHVRPIARLVEIGQALSVFGITLSIRDPKGNTESFRSITRIMENIWVKRNQALIVILSGPSVEVERVDKNAIRGANMPFDKYLDEHLNDHINVDAPMRY